MRSARQPTVPCLEPARTAPKTQNALEATTQSMGTVAGQRVPSRYWFGEDLTLSRNWTDVARFASSSCANQVSQQPTQPTGFLVVLLPEDSLFAANRNSAAAGTTMSHNKTRLGRSLLREPPKAPACSGALQSLTSSLSELAVLVPQAETRERWVGFPARALGVLQMFRSVDTFWVRWFRTILEVEVSLHHIYPLMTHTTISVKITVGSPSVRIREKTLRNEAHDSFVSSVGVDRERLLRQQSSATWMRPALSLSLSLSLPLLTLHTRNSKESKASKPSKKPEPRS
jgi:hypothetical protein